MVRRILRQLPLPKNLPVPRPITRFKVLKTPTLALNSVISKDGLGIYASSDTIFKGAIFGRDSLKVAEDLMYIRPRLARRILLTLASLQGTGSNKKNEEEPGKIVHEYRRQIVDEQPIKGEQKEIFDKLSKRWGGKNNELAYYGSIDATPYFLRTLYDYCQAHGDNILSTNVGLRDKEVVSMLEVARRAAEWLSYHLGKSKSGLVEYRRQNPEGIMNQAWKDSNEFYIHEDGQRANHNKPIASIEVQGLAYDALLASCYFFPDRQAEFLKRAGRLRDLTLRSLWLEERNFFALGLDFGTGAKPRLIRTITANPAELLNSRIFEKLSVADRKKYVSALVREIMGTEFLTDAGVRSRALSEAKLVSFWDYHGSYTTWPKETSDIAFGLRRQGLPKLAAELENRLINVIRAVGSYPEFIYVDARGRIMGSASTSRIHGELVVVEGRDRPEKTQAWTVSAYLAITALNLKQYQRRSKSHQDDWQKELEAEVIRAIPHVKRYRGHKELAARYPSYPYELKDLK